MKIKPKYQCYYCEKRKYFKEEIHLDLHLYRRHFEYIIPIFPPHVRRAPTHVKKVEKFIIKYKIPLSEIITNP